MAQFDLTVVEKFTSKNHTLNLMEKTKREHQHYYVYVSWKNGRTAKQIHQELRVAEGPNALSEHTIYWWIEAFKDGDESIEDNPCSGHPCEAVTPRTIAKVEELVDDNPHITIRMIEEEVGISKERIESILHSQLDLNKVCSRWIPHVITDANKQKRVELAKQMLRVLDGGFQNIITGDETWFNYYTVSTKEDNKVWLKSGELRPQIARTSKNSKKRMFCVFFTVEGLWLE